MSTATNDNAPAALAPPVEVWSGKDRADENFPVGSWLIAKKLRPHIHAFYAFARNADDIADHETLAPAEKLDRLDIMEAVLLGHRADGAPSATRLRQSLAETGVTATHARELLTAFRQDATKSRYEDWAALLNYCRYSAAPVGRHVLDLHGEAQETWPASDALCAALQVLNHLQDGADDLHKLDRCYIPQDWLAECGATTDDLARDHATPGLRQVFDRMLAETTILNNTAAALPGLVRARRLRLEAAVIAGLARRLTTRLQRQDPLAMRVKLRPADVLSATITALPRLA
jgi:farnesyl-diphosphate farnesyltransferase